MKFTRNSNFCNSEVGKGIETGHSPGLLWWVVRLCSPSTAFPQSISIFGVWRGTKRTLKLMVTKARLKRL